MWLILNGKIPVPWHDSGRLSLTDWYGNQVHLPTTAAISLVFSVMSMVKAAIEFNIIRVHIQVKFNFAATKKYDTSDYCRIERTFCDKLA